jgi:hypothetical protein
MADPTPQDQTRPLPAYGNENEVAPGMSFAEMPGNEEELEEDRQEREEQKPAKEAPTPAQPPPPPVGAADIGNAVAQAFDIAERRRYAEALSAQQRQDSDEEMRRAWEPEPMPDDDQVAEILSDPKKFKEFVAGRDNGARVAISAAVQPLLNDVAGMRGAMTTLYQNQHIEAWNQVRRQAAELGIENPDRFYGPLHKVLEQDPATYWQRFTSPATMLKAVEFMARSAEPEDRPMQPFRSSNRSAGGERNAPRSDAPVRLSHEHNQIIADVEKKMKVKFSDKDRREFVARLGVAK